MDKERNEAQDATNACTGNEKEYHREHHAVWSMYGNGITTGNCMSCKKVLAVEVNDGTTKFQYNKFLK